MAAVKEEPKQETKREVQARLADWRQRIEALYDQIEAWATRAWGEGCTARGLTWPLQEYPMKRVGIPAGRFPTLTVRAGDRTIEFRPRCLWIDGANGQLDIRAGDRHFFLADHGGENGESTNWEITSPDPRLILEPFTRKVLLRLGGRKSSRPGARRP